MTIATTTPKPQPDARPLSDEWIARSKPNAPGHNPAPPQPPSPERPQTDQRPPAAHMPALRFGAPLLRHDTATNGSLWQRLRRRSADQTFDILVRERLERFITAPPANPPRAHLKI